MFCIELTSLCNFSCSYCPSQWMTRDKKHISYRTAIRNLEAIATNKLDSTIGFHVMGEPMLYPRFDEILKYAGRLGLQTVLVTNGSLLTPPRTKKIAPYLNQIIISVNGNSASLHELRGCTLKYDNYMSRIRAAAAVLLEQQVIVTISYMSGSLPQADFICTKREQAAVLREWRRFSQQIEKPALSRKKNNLRSSFIGRLKKETAGECFALPGGLNVLFRPISPLWAGNPRPGHRSPQADPSRMCNFTPSILSNGKFVLCCGDFDGRMSIGNADTTSVHEILKQNHALIARIADINQRGLLFERTCTGCSPRTKACPSA
jgi:organic radical activating enzyme